MKDLPGLKKGTILSEGEPIFGVRTLITKNNSVGTTFIGNELFDEFFEKIQEEPTDSIHWKPKIGDRYFYISGYGTVYSETWHGVPVDYYRRALGFIYPTEEECKKARERKLAKVRLQRASNFKPDFESGKGGYVVSYDYINKKLDCSDSFWNDSGEPVRYATKEEAEKSIEENREDWLTYLGIKEEE